MKFALFIVIVNAAPQDNGQDLYWAVDGNMTQIECEAMAQEKAPRLDALYHDSTVAYLTCEEDHAPDAW